MKSSHFFLFIFSVTIFIGCVKVHKLLSIKSNDRILPGMNNNVCKKLKGEAILYAIFVDSKYTQPWTEYDIQSTLDSINRATQWIESKAGLYDIALNIKVQYHKNGDVVPLVGQFPRKTLKASLFQSNGVKRVDKWADQIAKVAEQSLPKDSTKTVRSNLHISDRERLISRLRNIYKTDNVALMYFVNNFYKNETSVAIHTGSETNIEYSIVSFKNPGTIAHEFLHLFGAADLYISHYDVKRKMQKKKKMVMQEFPNEVMAFNYRRIETLEISPVTRYCVGWDNQLDPKYHKVMFGRKYKPVSY